MDNKDRWLMLWNAYTQKFSVADRQRDEGWIGGPAAESGVEWINNDQICYLSEATGYAHLYTMDLKSGTKSQKTSGNFEIQKMELSVDQKWIYVLSNAPHPGEQHWYRISVKAESKMEQITRMTGGYDVSMSHDNQWIAYRYSYSNKPWELYLQKNEPGSIPVQVTFKSKSPEFSSYPWRDPEVVSFSASDGTKVFARLYKPETAKRNGAAVVFVHGAGYLQNAHKRWSQYFREYMFHNLLTDLGYTVIDVDYRGSSGYGRDCRTGIYRHMGGKDLEDQADAVKFLVQNHQVDPKKVGIYGGSYGGFITLMALFTKPGMFKAGAALRSVTDWAHYNHGYTSNILNEPQNDSIAYRRSSPIYFAEGLQDRLLMCHGMVDVNVHFQDVVRLSQRLIELKKENWELAVYPVEDHGFVEPSSWADEYKRILKLFQEELLGKYRICT
jgi:dipeptidyl aminopeptidase/acylaminoacyl peptidase